MFVAEARIGSSTVAGIRRRASVFGLRVVAVAPTRGLAEDVLLASVLAFRMVAVAPTRDGIRLNLPACLLFA